MRRKPLSCLCAAILVAATNAQATARTSPYQSEDLDRRWTALVELRRRLSLPRRPTMHRSWTQRQYRQAAMQHIAAGLAVRLKPDPETPGFPGMPLPEYLHELTIANHFRAAAEKGPDGVEALLALANSATDDVIKKLALTSLDVDRLIDCDGPKVATLLLNLLEDASPEIAADAYTRLIWLLDGQPAAGGVAQTLAARALKDWPEDPAALQAAEVGIYMSEQPGATTVLPFGPPPNLASRLVTFAALRGDATVLERLDQAQVDRALRLQCDALAAPRVDATEAEQLFRRYSRTVERWASDTFDSTRLHNAQFAAITTLVAVLPRLPDIHAAWYERHLAAGALGQAALLAATHRMLRLDRHAGRDWLELRSAATHRWAPGDALRLWRYLGKNAQWTLAGCVAAAPRPPAIDSRQPFVCQVLADAPLGTFADEEAVLAALWRDADPIIDLLAARRAAMFGKEAEATISGWLHDAIADRPALALEVAIESGRPLPTADLASAETRAPDLVRVHRALFGERSDELDALLSATVEPDAEPLLRSILHAARNQTSWSNALADFVATQTTHAETQVRLAAYRALLSRDPSEHECAWLAYECVFDTEPEVRRLAVR